MKPADLEYPKPCRFPFQLVARLYLGLPPSRGTAGGDTGALGVTNGQRAVRRPMLCPPGLGKPGFGLAWDAWTSRGESWCNLKIASDWWSARVRAECRWNMSGTLAARRPAPPPTDATGWAGGEKAQLRLGVQLGGTSNGTPGRVGAAGLAGGGAGTVSEARFCAPAATPKVAFRSAAHREYVL